jgi:uncharacterized protein (TIGR02145 family)
MKAKIVGFVSIMIIALGLQAQTTMNIYLNNGTVMQIPLNTIDSITYTIANPGNLATITTTAVGNITGTTAVSGGNITNNGGSPVTQRGVVWSTAPNPTTANNQSSDGSGTGSFTSNLTGLTANTTYYVRAYAINSAGTAYGNEVSFTTNISNLATIITFSVNSITDSTAISGGDIIDDGGSPVTQRGVVWSTAPNPTTANNQSSDGSGTGSFTSNLTGLTATTTYYVRAYAINSAGTAYGNEVSFTTTAGGGGIVTNPGAGVTFDGYTYSSIVLGNGQEWMAENLRTTVYANGDPIPNVTDSAQWTNLTSGAWVHYNNDSQYETPYGKLYIWYTVADSRNVCPTGWHVPSDAEWTVLSDYLGGEVVAGGKMKSTGTQSWLSPNIDATNESGFSGLPGGYRIGYAPFLYLGAFGGWWSSTEGNTANAWYRGLVYDIGNIDRGNLSKLSGFSVRCLRD